jgi:TonB family protein
MVLSIAVDAKGRVTNVRVVKSLSPHLDNAAADTVRTWRFKLKAGNLDSLPDDFPVHFFFRPMCRMSASISH